MKKEQQHRLILHKTRKNQNKKKQKDNSRELSFLFLHHIRHHRFYVENINQNLNVTLKLNFDTPYERIFHSCGAKKSKVFNKNKFKGQTMHTSGLNRYIGVKLYIQWRIFILKINQEKLGGYKFAQKKKNNYICKTKTSRHQ